MQRIKGWSAVTVQKTKKVERKYKKEQYRLKKQFKVDKVNKALINIKGRIFEIGLVFFFGVLDDDSIRILTFLKLDTHKFSVCKQFK